MHTFLTDLAGLHKDYYSPRIIPLGKNRTRYSSKDTSSVVNKKNDVYSDDEGELSLDTFSLDDSPSVIRLTLDDGIKLHKEKSESSRRLAWESFKYHAGLGDPRAIYWKGYYLLEGYGGVEKNLAEASKCFKEAADQDIADAQVRYAFTIIHKAKDNRMIAAEFLKYLEKAAFHENPTALYNLGNVYYEGKLGLQRDKKQAIIYYKQAALKGHDKSIERLGNLDINIYGD
jgi:TPR repeat protein